MNRLHIIEQKHLKENPFSVPDGYFSLLPQRLHKQISKISAEEYPVVQFSSFKTRLKSQLSLAASLVIMIGMGYAIVHFISPNRSDRDLSYTEYISLFNSYSLLQNDEWENAFDSEDIISYLTDHGISPDAIAYLE